MAFVFFFIILLLSGTFLIEQVTSTDANIMYNYQTHTQCGLVWAADNDRSVLPHAVYAGKEKNGQEVYVARGHSGSDLIPGKFLRNQKILYIPLGGERKMESFQMLTNPNDVPIEWLNYTGTFPSTALLVGSQGGNPAFIGRYRLNGDTVVGYVRQPYDKGSTNLLYGWGDSLHSTNTFEILVTPQCKIKQIITKLTEVKPSPAAQKMAQQMYNQQVYDRCGLVWIPNAGNYMVANAVSAGKENSQVQLHIARAIKDGQLKAGKFVAGTGMYMVHGNQEITQSSFQVLTNPHAISLDWVTGPSIPSTAIVAGSIEGKPVYIGRFGGENKTRLGYLYPARDGKLRFGVNGQAYTTEDFQVLVAPNCDTTGNAQDANTSDQLEAYEDASHVAQYMYEKTVHDKCGFVWRPHSGTSRVPNALPAGPDISKKATVFPARTLSYGQLVLGKFIDTIGMHFADLGKEVSKSSDFEVLTNPDDVPIKWAPLNGTNIPTTALVAGLIVKKPVYIGRTMRESDTVVGYLYPTKHTQLVYTYANKVFATDKYEILLIPDCA